MIITIAGMPGAGKTVVAKKLAKKLGYKHVSGGDLRGALAIKHGMTLDELNEIGLKESWTDKEIDAQFVEIAKKGDNYVIDSWTAFHFIPQSIKIFLDVSFDEAARRLIKTNRPDEKPAKNIEEEKKRLEHRVDNTIRRFLKYYGFNFIDKKNYDFILDTTNLSVDEVYKKILGFIESRN